MTKQTKKGSGGIANSLLGRRAKITIGIDPSHWDETLEYQKSKPPTVPLWRRFLDEGEIVAVRADRESGLLLAVLFGDGEIVESLSRHFSILSETTHDVD